MLHLPRACLESFRQRFALLQGKTGGGSKDGEQHAARPAHDALEALAVQPGHSFAVAGLARLDKHAAAPAPAPTCPISQKRVALVVGNSAYPGAARPGNPGNDADDVAAVLRDKLCFAVTLAKDLKYEDFADKIGEFAERTAGADVALLYCAGHGMQVNATNWLVPVDAKFQSEFSVTHSNISAQEVVGQIQSRAKATIVILDACRNNPLENEFRSRMTSAGRALPGGERGLAPPRNTGTETLLVYSAGPKSVAADGAGRNSPFTKAFLRRYDRPGTLFYLDPPYWGSEGYSGKEMFSRADFELLSTLQGRFILSLNDHPGVRTCFSQFSIESVEVSYSVSQTGPARSREVIISGGGLKSKAVTSEVARSAI